MALLWYIYSNAIFILKGGEAGARKNYNSKR